MDRSWATSIGLFRAFRVTERIQMQIRAEAYNATNTAQWGLPAANISAVTYNSDGSVSNLGGFGSMTATDGSYLGRAGMDERTFRFGARFLVLNCPKPNRSESL